MTPHHPIELWTECSPTGRVWAANVSGLILTAKTLDELGKLLEKLPKACPCRKVKKVCIGYEGPAR